MLLIILAFTGFSNDVNFDLDKYEKIINSMLTDIDEIIKNGKYSKNIIDVYTITNNCITTEKIHFSIDPEKDTILGGMSFGYNTKTGETDFSFGRRFLDTYRKGKTIHLVIMMHEMRHLYDFTTNQKLYLEAKNNKKEEYWFELDAIHIEAEFIETYLQNRILSEFEQFVLNSFQKDNLDSISVFMKHERMNVFFYFNSLEERYRNDNKMQNSIISEIISNCEDLIQTYNNTNINDYYKSHLAYISLCSYKKFMLSTMVVILESPNMTWGEVFNKYPRFEKIYNQINEIQNKDNAKQAKYAKSIFDFWESDIRKKIAA